MSFATVTSLYEIATRATATRETVGFAPAARLAACVRALSRELLGDDGTDELFESFLRRSRRVVRLLALTPLPADHPALDLGPASDYLRGLTDLARGSYPDRLVARADLCTDALADLAHMAANPLGDLAVEIIQTGAASETGLVVQTPLAGEVAEWLQDRTPQATLVSEEGVHKAEGFQSLIFVGPSSWYPAHVLSAPRAELLCFVHYTWLRDREVDTRVFAGSPQPAGARLRTAEVPFRPGDPVVTDAIDADELVPTVNWDALAKAATSRTSGPGDPDVVEGRLFVLAGGRGVYLETAEGATIDTVDVEADEQRLRSTQARSIGPGDYIVLRTEGGTGDYIPEVANAQLGKKASQLRALQRLWKEALRERVRVSGFAGVERDLRDLGIRSPNLRYRLWYRSIRTQNPQDFRTLMDYLDLGDRAAVIWTAMGEIVDAHRKAGHEVRRQLEQAFEQADLDDLLQTGRLDVSLEALEAGMLSAIRVEARSPGTFELHEDDFRVLLEVDEDLWHG